MKTLQQLIQDLNAETKEKGICNALDLLTPFDQYTGEDWKSYFKTPANEFQSSVLHMDDHFKLLLIYWNGHNKTAKHGHMKGGGLMRILSGQIVETRFDPDDQEKITGTFTYSKGDLIFIHDELAYHVVENRRKEPAVSLHLYCNGINQVPAPLKERA